MTDAQDISTIDTSKEFHNSEVTDVSTFKELREKAGLTAFNLAVESEVSLSTINRMEYGSGIVTRRIANHVLSILGAKLGRRIAIEDVEGLRVK